MKRPCFTAFEDEMPLIGFKHSPESKERMSLAQTGRKHSYETRMRMRKTATGRTVKQSTREKIRMALLGRHLSEETKRKVGLAGIGRKHSEESKDKIRQASLLHRHSEESLAKMSLLKSGPNNPNWQGGISFNGYPKTFSKKLKATIRDRDGHICQLCGVDESTYKHPVHHIDYNKKHNWPSNLTELCCGCNVKVNYDRKYWREFFRWLIAGECLSPMVVVGGKHEHS